MDELAGEAKHENYKGFDIVSIEEGMGCGKAPTYSFLIYGKTGMVDLKCNFLFQTQEEAIRKAIEWIDKEPWKKW